MRLSLALALALLLAGCTTTAVPDVRFFDSLKTLCGKAFVGRLVSQDAVDDGMRGKPLIMHVRQCSENEVRIPFHVGSDRSRTWVIARSWAGLRLLHDHRHADGSPDVLTLYGGDSLLGPEATPRRQLFPANEHSKALFVARGNPASVANIWALEIDRGRIFTYELRRPGRFFRVEFDLGRPVTPPPPP
jgi:hypothetical protein